MLDNYTALCTRLYLFLITKLPWVSITPSLHKLLAHSAELIRANDGCGLEAFSEEGMEANNKRLRQIRTELSRKTSQQDNLTDCFKRLWTGSDPLVCQERRKGQKTCKVCQAFGHTGWSKMCPARDVAAEDQAFADLLI